MNLHLPYNCCLWCVVRQDIPRSMGTPDWRAEIRGRSFGNTGGEGKRSISNATGSQRVSLMPLVALDFAFPNLAHTRSAIRLPPGP